MYNFVRDDRLWPEADELPASWVLADGRAVQHQGTKPCKISPQGHRINGARLCTHIAPIHIVSHPAIVKRLAAGGHLNSIVEMITRPLLPRHRTTATSGGKAIQQAKKTLIQEHLDHCVRARSTRVHGRVQRDHPIPVSLLCHLLPN